MKLFKKCMHMLLIFALAISVTSTAFGAEWSVNDKNFTGTIMPIAQHSDAYHQLTEEELNSDTDTLIDLLLDNGYTFDLTLSSQTNVKAYEHIRSYFNGFQELESRSDAGSLMLKRLTSGESDDTDFIDLWLLRILLSQPVYKAMLTAEEQQLLIEAVARERALRTVPVIEVNELIYDSADTSSTTTGSDIARLYQMRLHWAFCHCQKRR